MNVERAAGIIAAYGGDASRWPDGERAAALQLVEANLSLTQARRAASALDAEMSMWSQRMDDVPVVPGQAAAAAARVLAASPMRVPVRRPAWRWALGTGMAAAIAAGVMLTNPVTHRSGNQPAHPQLAHNPAADAAAFAMVFTPTPDEDGSI